MEIPNLEGEWIGHYKNHFDEVIRIRQDGKIVEAIKITGDDFVPADEVTWRANLSHAIERNGGFSGEGQIAEKEFRNPRFIPGKLKILSHNRIKFCWDSYGEVEFRKDDI